MTPAQRTSLRQSLRHTRRLLSPRQQRDAAIALHHALAGQRFFRSAKRLAFYQAIDGEIDPSLLLAEAQSRGQACFLPLLHPFRHGRLLFVRYREGDPLQPNRWGIAQPRLLAHRLVSPRWLMSCWCRWWASTPMAIDWAWARASMTGRSVFAPALRAADLG